jgi:molybdopterin converting factor small subunit
MPTSKLYTNLRKTAWEKELYNTGANLDKVLNLLIGRFPVLYGAVLENEQIRYNTISKINGHNTTDPNMAVTEQDRRTIFPPIAWG